MSQGRGRILSLLRTTAIFLALWTGAGCSGARQGAAPPPPDFQAPGPADNAARARSAVIPPVVPLQEAPGPEGAADRRGAEERAQAPEKGAAPAGTAAEAEAPAATEAPPAPAGAAASAQGAAPPPPPEIPSAPVPGASPPARPAPSPRTATAAKPKGASRAEPEAAVREAPPEGPAWARQKEVLAYRVDFIGITMGYARFSYVGKVSVGGRVAYHLNVRAWTSGALSYIYPINETIDYYLDAETLAPVRQEFTQRPDGKDDVAIYDQETGKITYRFLATGEIRKEVEAVPEVYDPVSAAYYFRWKDMGREERPRNVYAGRKVWQISTRLLGVERLDTERGPVETLVIQPVIRRDGKPENKGDLKMWVSNDERRVPVRLYAKFRKILDWTLVGELMPVQTRG